MAFPSLIFERVAKIEPNSLARKKSSEEEVLNSARRCAYPPTHPPHAHAPHPWHVFVYHRFVTRFATLAA